jgi:hypothetical protein
MMATRGRRQLGLYEGTPVIVLIANDGTERHISNGLDFPIG